MLKSIAFKTVPETTKITVQEFLFITPPRGVFAKKFLNFTQTSAFGFGYVDGNHDGPSDRENPINPKAPVDS